MKIRCLTLVVAGLVGCAEPGREDTSSLDPTGGFETYYPNGQLFEKGSYSNGLEDGPYERYYESGQLSVKGGFSDGLWDGPWESYAADGQLQARGSYADGERCGRWIEGGEDTMHPDCPTDRDPMNGSSGATN